MTNDARHVQGLLPETHEQIKSYIELLRKLYCTSPEKNDDEEKKPANES